MRRTRGEEEEEENDEPEIPLHHKRPFGAGLKRKKIEFVRATESDPGLPSSSTSSAGKGSLVGDLYASIVLGEVSSQSGPASRTESPGAPTDDDDEQSREPIICPVCALPITTSLREHEASLAHQVSMTHSHPPSGLDRTRMGLRTLQSQGWDPDARRGLGLEGEGPRYPIKVAAKEDNLGIGASAQQANEDAKKKKKEKESEAPPRQLTAKERKALAAKERQRAERLQAEIYGRVDVEGYLRGNGADNAI